MPIFPISHVSANKVYSKLYCNSALLYQEINQIETGQIFHYYLGTVLESSMLLLGAESNKHRHIYIERVSEREIHLPEKYYLCQDSE